MSKQCPESRGATTAETPTWKGPKAGTARGPALPSFACTLACLLSLGVAQAQTPSGERFVESIVPLLDANSSCASVVSLQNLGEREIEVEVDGHKGSGALAALTGQGGAQVRLRPGERAEYKLQTPEETGGGWVRVREKIPGPQLSPVLAVSGATECSTSDQLKTTLRDVAWPTRNPRLSADVSYGDPGVVLLFNTSEQPVRVWGCYSSGTLYSVPKGEGSELVPLCSETISELVPPFGARQFPVARGRNSHLSITTQGDAIVLQMLRPTGSNVKTYRAESAITFGQEVSAQ
jgi:hypothetical protein